MRLLLDTHALIWWLDDSPAVPERIAQLLESAEADVAVSAASVWEIEIKRALGKLDAPPDLVTTLEGRGFRQLPVTWAHAAAAGALPRHHDDPFDRVLVAQAQLEGMTLATADPELTRYAVHTMWAG